MEDLKPIPPELRLKSIYHCLNAWEQEGYIVKDGVIPNGTGIHYVVVKATEKLDEFALHLKKRLHAYFSDFL